MPSDVTLRYGKPDEKNVTVKRGAIPGARASSRSTTPWHMRQGEGAPTPEMFEIISPQMAANPIPQLTTLLVDHREPGEVVDLLRTVVNLNVEVTTLETGDYVVPDHLVIERKTTSDFVNSVIGSDKRLFHQAAALNASGMRSMWILEGDPYNQVSMPIKNVDGTLTYLMLIRRIPVFYTRSLAHTAEVIAKAVRHAVYGLGYADPASKAMAPQNPKAAAAYMLSCSPGVSSTLGIRLVAHFGSIRAICAAEVSELRAVDGVGPVIAASIRDTLSV